MVTLQTNTETRAPPRSLTFQTLLAWLGRSGPPPASLAVWTAARSAWPEWSPPPTRTSSAPRCTETHRNTYGPGLQTFQRVPRSQKRWLTSIPQHLWHGMKDPPTPQNTMPTSASAGTRPTHCPQIGGDRSAGNGCFGRSLELLAPRTTGPPRPLSLFPSRLRRPVPGPPASPRFTRPPWTAGGGGPRRSKGFTCRLPGVGAGVPRTQHIHYRTGL